MSRAKFVALLIAVADAAEYETKRESGHSPSGKWTDFALEALADARIKRAKAVADLQRYERSEA